MVNLELYKVFYTVARCGSLTKAAEELYISQPAVSQAIKQLETQLGTPLFNRMHKGMELSKQGGMLIYPDVEKALRLLDGVEDKLSEMQKSATGTLRIGASETIFQYILAEKIVAYHKLCPQVKIELISDVSPRIIEFLKTDRCDVGFLNLPIPPDDGIVITDTVALSMTRSLRERRSPSSRARNSPFGICRTIRSCSWSRTRWRVPPSTTSPRASARRSFPPWRWEAGTS